jgi:hypothetical protein
MNDYTSLTDLANYLAVEESALSADSQRLLDRAAEMVEFVMAGRYDSSNWTHRDAAAKAACAQVEYWLTNGESIGPAIKSKTVGKTSVTYADSAGTGDELAPRAKRILWIAGLRYAGGDLA